MLPNEFTCQAVLFDLDGVLVDSRAAVERTWARWAQRHGLERADIAPKAHGRRSIDSVREFAPHLDAEAEVAWLEAAELDDVDGLVAIPGAASALNAVPEVRRAVVTSGGRALAIRRLTAVGLPIPTTLVSAEEVRRGKPAPEGYLLAATRLGIASNTCVVIEDTPAGIEAGRAAGAIVIALDTTFRRDQLAAASVIVSSLAELRIAVGEDVLRIMASPRGRGTAGWGGPLRRV